MQDSPSEPDRPPSQASVPPGGVNRPGRTTPCCCPYESTSPAPPAPTSNGSCSPSASRSPHTSADRCPPSTSRCADTGKRRSADAVRAVRDAAQVVRETRRGPGPSLTGRPRAYYRSGLPRGRLLLDHQQDLEEPLQPTRATGILQKESPWSGGSTRRRRVPRSGRPGAGRGAGPGSGRIPRRRRP